jgi:adenosylhomocysteine nucleosidase
MEAALHPLATLHGRKVLFVMATEAEYGPHLRARIAPLMTHVGPVEAAIGVARALAELRAGGAPADLVVSLGSAGSARLEHTMVYQAVSVSYRDMDCSPLGFPKGQTPFLPQPPTIPLPLRLPGVPGASLSTGANIVSGAAYDAIPEDMVDMETYAVLRACQSFATPLITLRGISDGRSELGGFHDWTEYLHVVDRNLAAALDHLDALLAGGAEGLEALENAARPPA